LVTSDKAFSCLTPEVEALKGKITESEIFNALIITESQEGNCHIFFVYYGLKESTSMKKTKCSLTGSK
jgi:hypothetical protein